MPYKKRTEAGVVTCLRKIYIQLDPLALQYTNKLKRNVSTYFERAMEPDLDSYSKFYGSPKVHTTTIGFQLVCATCMIYICI